MGRLDLPVVMQLFFATSFSWLSRCRYQLAEPDDNHAAEKSSFVLTMLSASWRGGRKFPDGEHAAVGDPLKYETVNFSLIEN
ncbi:hypothetical protein [Streptosporangium canum]|uniref:hypothetical protein n=1 Tax=Streptosporangium canum TaxID=324952 RepID=UPI001160A826|nr:hypothetical protein [Streptosporangium canum]